MYYDLRYHSLGHKEKVPLLSTRWRVYMRKWRGMHWVGAGKLGHEETPRRMTNSRLMKTFSLTLIKAKLLSLYKKNNNNSAQRNVYLKMASSRRHWLGPTNFDSVQSTVPRERFHQSLSVLTTWPIVQEHWKYGDWGSDVGRRWNMIAFSSWY